MGSKKVIRHHPSIGLDFYREHTNKQTHTQTLPFIQSFSIQSCAESATRIFVGCIALKPLFYTLVLTLLYVKIPIQQILHVLLTVGYKCVIDLENLFYFLGNDLIGQFVSCAKITNI